MIEYKSKLQGVEIILINLSYTSQKCSRCGEIGNRQGKEFKCPCGHVDHADVNVAFNIGQSVIDRDITEGSTDTPKGEILIKSAPEPPLIYRGGSGSHFILLKNKTY